MKFYKSHALGNDFILIKTPYSLEDITKDFILKINDRFTGIGADQVLAIDEEKNVKIWTQNGENLTLCGNGLRCLAKLLNEPLVTLNTDSGPVVLKNMTDGSVSMTVQKVPILKKLEDHYSVDVGNLHKIFFVENLEKIDILSYANPEFIISFLAQINGQWHIRTMENHTTKETLACGSASLAAANALHHLGYKDLTVHYKLGSITHTFDSEKMIQIGPAEIVAEIQFFETFFK